MYPLLRFNKLSTQFLGSTVFSQLDLHDSYHKLPIYPPDCHKSAFTCWYNMYQFNIMAFRFCNAPNIFQYVINMVFFFYFPDSTINVYLDGLLIYSRDLESYHQALHAMF